MKNIILLIILLSGLSSEAGVPKKHPNCSDKRGQIIDPKGSQGYFFDETCDNAYVLPPVEGQIKLSSSFSEYTTDDCKSYMSVINALNSSVQRNNDAREALDKAYKHLLNKDSKVANLQKQCDRPREILNQADLILTAVEEKIQIQQKVIEQLTEVLEKCKNDEARNCSSYDYQIVRAQREVVKLEDQRLKISNKRLNVEVAVKSCEKTAENEIAKLESQDKDYKLKYQTLLDSNKELLEQIKNEASSIITEVGAQLNIGYYSGHHDLVSQYKNLNKVGVTFHSMPLQKGLIHFERILDGAEAKVPVIQKANINGLISVSADKEMTFNDFTQGTSNTSVAFGNAAGGTMVINKYAACSMASNMSASSASEKIKAISEALKPTVTFAFDVQVERKIKIKYNESHLYQLIKKSTKKNGLFRSKTSNSITEKSEAEKWILIDISSEDENHVFADSEKLMLDIRQEYLDSALAKVAKSYLTEQQANLIDPGPDGATKSANELRNNCRHVYCQVGAIVLNISSALFGGSSAESSMKRTVSAEEWQELTDKKTVREFGQQTLSVKRE